MSLPIQFHQLLFLHQRLCTRIGNDAVKAAEAKAAKNGKTLTICEKVDVRIANREARKNAPKINKKIARDNKVKETAADYLWSTTKKIFNLFE